MNPATRKLIEKIALSPETVGNAAAARLGPGIRKTEPLSPKHKDYTSYLKGKPPEYQAAASTAFKSRLHGDEAGVGAGKQAQTSMRNIIDDIIKGAEQNTFGRPVNIQRDTDWTHLDTAKVAGMLQALGEQEYSVKEAAEYLGLTEDVVQCILTDVR